MKRTSLLMAVFLALLWPSFGRGQKSVPKAKVEIIDGVEWIHNPGTPLHPEKTVAFVEELAIGGEDKEGNDVLSLPGLSYVDDHENIYIQEAKDQVIKIFGPDGKLIKTIGAKGSGPGEFQSISSLSITKDGRLIIMDRTSRRTSLFDSSGRFIKSFPRRTGDYRLILVKDSSYIVGILDYIGDDRIEQLSVEEVDFNGKEKEIKGEFVSPKSLRLRDGNTMLFTGSPVTRASEFAGDQERGLFYHCVNDAYMIEAHDAAGKVFRKFDRPYKPVPFTDQDAKEYRARLGNPPSESFRKALAGIEMPKIKSIVESMLVDDKGNLWIQTNETRKDGDKILTAYDIFDSSGYYSAKVWSPFIPRILKKGKMYRMETDQDTGYRSLKRYKIVWN